MHHVVPGVMRPLRILWNQIIGFMFIVIGLGVVPSLVRGFRDLGKPSGSLFRVIVSLIFIVLMGYFGINSFLRARKISRS